ncbi:hypothetical protein CPB84DRAFT_741543 [Gymnopilus junonius]|uniref:Uncharacterized protein n=1 Tax=Gymnopilus junonius TaxID=109634 RepID=A0A9P5P2F1_GYMJU|nr:hypothetical protein CPB84DRAFT_741543 [Gymnopilus junonius]
MPFLRHFMCPATRFSPHVLRDFPSLLVLTAVEAGNLLLCSHISPLVFLVLCSVRGSSDPWIEASFVFGSLQRMVFFLPTRGGMSRLNRVKIFYSITGRTA